MDSVESRRNAIAALINEKGEITFAQLKEAFPNVSDMTLRTDLKNLDEKKRIVRIHGLYSETLLARRSRINISQAALPADRSWEPKRARCQTGQGSLRVRG